MFYILMPPFKTEDVKVALSLAVNASRAGKPGPIAILKAANVHIPSDRAGVTAAINRIALKTSF
jgi:hypothetical protein